MVVSVSSIRTDFDPVALEILWSRLIAITDETAAALVRTAFSTIVRESNDFCCSLLDARGNALADSTLSIPSFLGVMPTATRHILKWFPPETLEPGDAILTNDPWIGSGHLNDFTLVMPIFHRGRLIAFAGNIAHTADIGGQLWSADAQEVFEEGMWVVPTKLVKAGKFNQELINLIKGNVRVPDQVIGDLHAQVAAAKVCERRLLDLMEEQGMEDLSALGEATHARAEQAMRRAIEAIPDGEYTSTVETDGFEQPIVIRCKITIRGSELVLDYAGTSPQINRGLNSVYTYAFTTYALKCLLDPTTPKNEGSYRPITVIAPEGSIVNPRYPAAVGARNLIGHYLVPAVFRALAPAVPDRIIADSHGPRTHTLFSGIGHDGRKFSLLLFPQGGMGARSNRDGLSCTAFPSNTGAGSFEVIEHISTLLCRGRWMMQDSAGAGRFRGGLGQEAVIEIVGRDPVKLSVLSERLRHPPMGLFGGLDGAPATIQLNEGDPLPTKGRTVLKPGDVMRVTWAGGGGYGPPRGRDRTQVLDDLKNELISPAAARDIYSLEA